MSEEQLKAFLKALEADTDLQAKLKAAVEGEIDTPDETAVVLEIAKEAGFGITAAEAENIRGLSDEELEGVAGGTEVLGHRVGFGSVGRDDLIWDWATQSFKTKSGKPLCTD
jgi:predicted ribosomally synthesized peptide with nif11-like leader